MNETERADLDTLDAIARVLKVRPGDLIAPDDESFELRSVKLSS